MKKIFKACDTINAIYKKKKSMYWQMYIEIKNVSRFPAVSEYISCFLKVPLNERETGTINNHLVSFS